jgi:type VI secretion system protein ImpA
MEAFDFSALTRPISEAEPCGRDLEMADHLEFMQFMARAEGLLPTSFFAFDRTTIDFPAEFATIAALLGESLDLRLMCVLAKLFALNRDLAHLAACAEAIATLLSERWDDVHPRGEDGDFGMRMAVLQSLDDGPPMVLPVQHIPLAESRRFGPITFRSQLVAVGEAKPRESEQTLDRSTIEGVLMEAELPRLVETRDHLRKLQGALARIRATCVAKAGYEQAVSFDNLGPVVERTIGLIEPVIVRRDPSAAPKAANPPDPEAAGPASGNRLEPLGAPSLHSTQEAAGALAAVAAYFQRFEPSNPAVLLVRQAEQLMGRSFLEVMRILMPNQAEQATIQIRGEQGFDLPIERLSALLSEAESFEEPAFEETREPADGSDPAGGQPANGAERRFETSTRGDALGLLAQVGHYYRVVEPSSPVPLLTERAISLAERDFLGLLKDLLPEPPRDEQSGEFTE